MNSTMEEDRIWILFGRRISGEITPEELKELQALMRERPDEGHSMEMVLEFWESERKADERADAERAQRLWPRLEAAMHNTKALIIDLGDNGERTSGKQGK
jgi:hypothetical protein